MTKSSTSIFEKRTRAYQDVYSEYRTLLPVTFSDEFPAPKFAASRTKIISAKFVLVPENNDRNGINGILGILDLDGKHAIRLGMKDLSSLINDIGSRGVFSDIQAELNGKEIVAYLDSQSKLRAVSAVPKPRTLVANSPSVMGTSRPGRSSHSY